SRLQKSKPSAQMSGWRRARSNWSHRSPIPAANRPFPLQCTLAYLRLPSNCRFQRLRYNEASSDGGVRGSYKCDGISMDSLIATAASALSAGDPLAALKRIALRDDPPAL